MVADAGPPLVLMAIGLVLWLAVTATLAGISVQTIGVILFVVGAVWLVIEMIQARLVTRTPVEEERVIIAIAAGCRPAQTPRILAALSALPPTMTRRRRARLVRERIST